MNFWYFFLNIFYLYFSTFFQFLSNFCLRYVKCQLNCLLTNIVFFSKIKLLFAYVFNKNNSIKDVFFFHFKRCLRLSNLSTDPISIQFMYKFNCFINHASDDEWLLHQILIEIQSIIQFILGHR